MENSDKNKTDSDEDELLNIYLKEENTIQYIGQPKLIGIIGDEDTCVGFILAGIGELNEQTSEPNYFVVDRNTDEYKLELIFLDMIERTDIGLVLITREAAEKIASVINMFKGLEPTVMIIPGHNGPFEFDMPLAIKNHRTSTASLRNSDLTHLKNLSTQSIRSTRAGPSLLYD